MSIRMLNPLTSAIWAEELSLDTMTGMTAYGWAKREAVVPDKMQEVSEGLYTGGGSFANFWFIGWGTDQTFQVHHKNSDHETNPAGFRVLFSTSPTLNEWFFWSVVLQAGVGAMKARWWNKDGVLQQELSLTQANVGGSGALDYVAIGGYPENGYGLDGLIGRTGFVASALTLQQITDEMTSHTPIAPLHLGFTSIGGSVTDTSANTFTVNETDTEGDGEDYPTLAPMAVAATVGTRATFAAATHLPQGLIYPG